MTYGSHQITRPTTTANTTTRITPPRQFAGTTAKSAKTKRASSTPRVRYNRTMSHHSGNPIVNATWAGRAAAFPFAILWALAVVAVGFGTAAFTGNPWDGIAASGSIVLISATAVTMVGRSG